MYERRWVFFVMVPGVTLAGAVLLWGWNMRKTLIFLLLGFLILTLAACGERATLPVEAGIGPRPTLPSPNPTLLPTVNIAPAKGWPAGEKPVAAAGLAVHAYATGLDHPRWLYVLPNGAVLVAETNASPQLEDGTGIKGWFMKLVKKRMDAGVPSAKGKLLPTHYTGGAFSCYTAI